MPVCSVHGDSLISIVHEGMDTLGGVVSWSKVFYGQWSAFGGRSNTRRGWPIADELFGDHDDDF